MMRRGMDHGPFGRLVRNERPRLLAFFRRGSILNIRPSTARHLAIWGPGQWRTILFSSTSGQLGAGNDRRLAPIGVIGRAEEVKLVQNPVDVLDRSHSSFLHFFMREIDKYS